MRIQLESIRREEVLRYLGWRGSAIPDEVSAQLDRCMEETLRVVQPRYVYRIFELERTDGRIRLHGTDVSLPGMDALLRDCERCILMAATLGIGLEAQIRHAQAVDMTQAILLDCCGSAAIDAVCDLAEQEILRALGKAERYGTDRFSPGYGNVPVRFQEKMTELLDTERNIGVTLTDSDILAPCKSVTALIGIADRPQERWVRGCTSCTMSDHCTFRKDGKTRGT